LHILYRTGRTRAVAEVGKALGDVQVLRQVDLTMRDGLEG